MCGIYGQFRLDGKPVSRSMLHSMGNSMTHRGPDDEGVFCDGGVGLGMRRLSIIDLAGGNQPFTALGGHVSLVANGEVYNFKALRLELEHAGYTFRSQSDCETILWGFFGVGRR